MTTLEKIKQKIFFSAAAFEKQLEFYRFKKLKTVFTNGCFDIVHLGHIDYLSKAADLGDILIVGLNSDMSVKKIKGPDRPIIDISSRSALLASLSFVDAVVIFDEETPLDLIRFILPDILVKGNDYTVDTIVGAREVINNGGEVVTIDLVKGYSTTLIEKKIVKNKE
ncbi:MAG TPA: D-glycero-beta-D-manno-heptose 1-phosphate adenylyltransferase [Bacteroidales bacterium]|jgi:rfaE bifunctional protein nucleotidyltransferase chain/domain|nr:D-glycero-beta-D-manno-heptose 1-phosphate adenylyltransferase [Bacteroidales bacterium]HNZ44247.1 D-glycero-beta-D-manno-heptose 1-phosphate adenylyltransferase [Bacteroidales bacterium]HOH83160.1 D-glycero-beta-D-manno-heptose 1-phosphate adenylyltransferase [Bacteroidales bacterium]HPI30697.1 D-glycero-beta-D-manno-heptose 1-phosphate adenylyltransferase [Bacteroidales bacterium]